MVKPTVKALVDKASAELVEELLEATRKNVGTPWFYIINAKMAKLASEIKKAPSPRHRPL